MPTVLYVGDGHDATHIAYEGFNRRTKPEKPWKVDDVPVAGFARATQEGLRSWLKGEIEGYPSQKSYDGIVIDSAWKDMVPVVREVHPNAPIIMFANEGAKVEGIDCLLRLLEINKLPEKMLELIAAKTA